MIEVIPPGVDECWMATQERNGLRARLGFRESEFVIAYFGSSAPLRGLPVLLQAFEAAQSRESRLRLLVLERRRPDESGRLPTAARSNPRVKILSGCFSPAQVAAHVQACDAAALPFELVPSDAPISILEAQAAGITLVTTRLGCLPELAEGGHHYLAEPGDVKSLARTLLQAANEASPVQSVHPSRPPRRWTHVGVDWAQLLRQL
jgi:glycosyltransferase involved in cell wall biosynthesis